MLGRAPQYGELLLVRDLELPGDRGTVTGPVLGMTVERHVRLGPSRPRPAEPVPAAGAPGERLVDEEEVWQALVTGTRDYVRKNGFRSVILGLSGGIDSAVTAVIAADALGPDAGARGLDALVVLLRALQGRRRRPGPPARLRLPHRADRADGRRLPVRRSR